VFCPSFVSLVVLFKGVPECADVACRSRLLQRGIEILEVIDCLPFAGTGTKLACQLLMGLVTVTR
jgi:hypothetical protein